MSNIISKREIAPKCHQYQWQPRVLPLSFDVYSSLFAKTKRPYHTMAAESLEKSHRKPAPNTPPPSSVPPLSPQTPTSPTVAGDGHHTSGTGIRMIGNYQLADNLGKGSMGKVKLAIHSVTGEKIAVKIVPRANLGLSQQPNQGKSPKQLAKELAQEKNREIRTIREAHLMMLLDHPNIVGLRDLVIDSRYFYILMDYVKGCQLLHYIVKRQRLSERRSRYLVRQIASALDYTHRNSIVHRDLKIENILIDSTGRTIKLIDFGLSTLFCPERLLTTYCGSLYFAAPELLRASPYQGPEIDVWSLGVVIYVMVTGAVPFDDTSMPGLHEKIKRGRVSYPDHVSDLCRDLLQRIFVTNPQDRINMTDIMNHPWLNVDAHSLIRNRMPRREPISMPLDLDVVEQMSHGLSLGQPNDIREKLEFILQSPVYRDASSHLFAVTSSHTVHALRQDGTVESPVYDGPQSIPAAYHPLISVYYLVQERRRRLANQEESHRVALSHKVSVESCLSVHTQQSQSETNDDQLPPRKPLTLGIRPTTANVNGASVDYLGRIQRWLRSSMFSKIHLSEKPLPELKTPSTANSSREKDGDDDDDDMPITPSCSQPGSTPKRSSFSSTRSILSRKFSFRLLARGSKSPPPPPSTCSFPTPDDSLRNRPLPPLPT